MRLVKIGLGSVNPTVGAVEANTDRVVDSARAMAADAVTVGIPLTVYEHQGVPFGDLLVRFDFGVIGAEVCEDLWSADGPIRRRAYAGAEIVAKFVRLFLQSVDKWVHAPFSLHFGNLDLERDRALQLPVVQKAEWTT